MYTTDTTLQRANGPAVLLGLSLTACGLALAASGASAQTAQSLVVPLSDASRPATLEVSLFNGAITVEPHEGSEIVIEPAETAKDTGPERDREGLHRIPNTAVGITAEEVNNTVTVSVDWTGRGLDLKILVPRRTSVHAHSVNGGGVTVSGVEGDHELQNVNGAIRARDIAGSLVAGTTNGDIEATFTAIADGKAMSFSTFNGDVDVSFPANLAANLSLNAGRGEVLTDFDLEIQPQTQVIDQSGDAGRYRVRLEREVRAVVGGGGPEIQFKTFNGDITIRRR